MILRQNPLDFRAHKRIIGSIFILLAFYLVYGIFSYSFQAATAWKQVLYLGAIALGFSAGYSQIWPRRWAIWAATPVALALLIFFPIGNLVSAYYFWMIFRRDPDAARLDNRLLRSLSQLTFADFVSVAFLAVLIPYGAFAGNTIGRLNFFAALLALIVSVLGITVTIYRRSSIAWFYVLMLALSGGILLVRSFEEG